MKKITDRVWVLLSDALQTQGLCPAENVEYIAERLTATEYKWVKSFLEYLERTGERVGRGNYQEQYKKYLTTVCKECGKDEIVLDGRCEGCAEYVANGLL